MVDLAAARKAHEAAAADTGRLGQVCLKLDEQIEELEVAKQQLLVRAWLLLHQAREDALLQHWLLDMLPGIISSPFQLCLIPKNSNTETPLAAQRASLAYCL